MVTQTKTDVKTVQSLLRQADVGTTLDLYTHAINKDKLVAQNQVMEAMMKPGLVNSESGIALLNLLGSGPNSGCTEKSLPPTSVALTACRPLELKRSHPCRPVAQLVRAPP